jgi:uncharacterized protein YciI
MRALVLVSLIAFLIISCNVDQPREAVSLKDAKVMHQTDHSTSGFDSAKAEKYGADDYGMKQYVMAFLKSGPNRPEDSNHAAELQKAHLNNISRLAKEGKLVLAGPFLDSDSLRGIYIFNTESIKEAKKLTESDPAIKYGSLKMELKSWYGSAALMEVNEIHKSLSKKEI